MKRRLSEIVRRVRSKSFRLLLGVRGAVLLLADSGWLLFSRPGHAVARTKVLVIRLDRIGDFLLWLPAARALRELYPRDQYELTLLAHPSWTDLARDQGIFDQVRALDVRRFVWNFAYRFGQLGWMRGAGFSAAIQARYSRELFVEDAILRASGATDRIGFRRENGPETRFQKPISDRWYTTLLETAGPSVTELERNAQLVRALGLTTFQTTTPELRVTEPPPPSLSGSPYYVLFPGASWDGKRWPQADFLELARRLFRQTGWKGVMCGGPGEEPLGESMAADAGVPLESWIGRTSLAQSAALIAGAQVLIGNDTSGIHMAASVGTPSVCVLGGGHYGRFLPYPPVRGGRPLPLTVVKPMDCFGCGWQCVYHVEPGQPVPCVRDVSVDAVWQSVCKVLRERQSVPTPAAEVILGEVQ